MVCSLGHTVSPRQRSHITAFDLMFRSLAMQVAILNPRSLRGSQFSEGRFIVFLLVSVILLLCRCNVLFDRTSQFGIESVKAGIGFPRLFTATLIHFLLSLRPVARVCFWRDLFFRLRVLGEN